MRLLIAIATTMSISASMLYAQPNQSCIETSENPEVCVQMRHLRSHLLMLEPKLYGETPDYLYFQTTGESMDQVVVNLMRSMSTNEHIDALEHLHLRLLQMKRHASDSSSETFFYANQLKEACTTCHDQIPTGSSSSDQLFTLDWIGALSSCRESGKNPFVCQKMHRMAKNLQFFRTADELGALDYSIAGQVAEDIEELAAQLAGLVAPVHPGGNTGLVTLRENAARVKELAIRKDPTTVDEGARLLESCQRCHTSLGN